MTSLPLFVSKKELLYTLFAIVVLFCFSLFYEFYKYKQVTIYSLHVSTSKIVNMYNKTTKKGKTYTVYKLKNSDFSFTTVNWTDLHVKIGDELEVCFFTKNLTFYKYLKGFYASSKFIRLKSKNKTNALVNFVQNQHENVVTKELYGALFFATHMSKNLRDDIAKWGISDRLHSFLYNLHVV